MYYFTCISFAIRASGRKSAMNIFIHHEWYEKEKKKQLEHQTNKQWYDLTILTILTTVLAIKLIDWHHNLCVGH